MEEYKNIINDLEDRIESLLLRVEALEALVIKLQYQVDNIHPIQYNIFAKGD